ncbi:MAG: hypothetical protein JSU86_03395, partial [Phycisphaerales bacterium]
LTTLGRHFAPPTPLDPHPPQKSPDLHPMIFGLETTLTRLAGEMRYGSDRMEIRTKVGQRSGPAPDARTSGRVAAEAQKAACCFETAA